jgi:F0F1-type ATP synthase membrane subunit c/vacuolar-type H+-ATPase subunit K
MDFTNLGTEIGGFIGGVTTPVLGQNTTTTVTEKPSATSQKTTIVIVAVVLVVVTVIGIMVFKSRSK